MTQTNAENRCRHRTEEGDYCVTLARQFGNPKGATYYFELLHNLACAWSAASTISVPSSVVWTTGSGRVPMCSRTASGFTTASRIIDENIVTLSDVAVTAAAASAGVGTWYSTFGAV